MDEPLTNENIPPFLLNAIIDDNTGEVDIKALIHGIEVLETKVNVITCPNTGKQLEYRHFIQYPTTKSVWNPAMATEVDSLIDTETTRLFKNIYTTRREGGIHQIGGRSETKQGSA